MVSIHSLWKGYFDSGESGKRKNMACNGNRRIPVSYTHLGSLENGRYNPSIILAFKIARYFDMSIEDIFIYEEEKL